MALSDVTLPTDQVEINGTLVDLYGITFPNLTALVNEHRSSLTRLYDEVANGKKKLDADGVGSLAGELLGAFPEIAATIIALAAQSPEAVGIARALPFPTQLDMLERIAKLTFLGDNNLKKFLETVTSLLGGVNRTMASVSL